MLEGDVIYCRQFHLALPANSINSQLLDGELKIFEVRRKVESNDRSGAKRKRQGIQVQVFKAFHSKSEIVSTKKQISRQ